MPKVPLNRYIRYDELTKLLQAFAKEYPKLVTLESIGKSFEGRDIWIVTVTNNETGRASDKPAFWCDGNIHASEVSATTAVTAILDRLCRDYGKNPSVTRALDTRTFYLVPRFNPDGAEWALADHPKIIRSSTRPYPYDEDDLYGLERKDIDGDGRMLTMRVADPNGAWKVAEEEPRLLRRRSPADFGGAYYRLIPEGLFHHFDGMTIRGRKVKEGLDMNRNFPSGWRLEHEQYGAGPYPTSEPEVRAIVDAIVQRPNICGAITFHTFSGVHLRPPSRMPDDDIPPEDLWVYKEIGKKGEEMTGYPAISNYHEFRYHPKEVITGVFDDWMYEHRGVFAWTTEIWSPQRQAGIKDYAYIDWFRDHPFEDDVRLLKWSDKNLDGKGHIDWYVYEHPQLGPVEIGGWDVQLMFRNPPPKYLEKEVKPFADWTVWQALLSPKLEIREARIEEFDGAHRVRMAVQNTGYLPTNVTKIADSRKLCRGVVGEIAREGDPVPEAGNAEPAWLLGGKLRQELGQLSGWSHITASGFGWQVNATDDVAVFEWIVRGPGKFLLKAHHERAGIVHSEIQL